MKKKYETPTAEAFEWIVRGDLLIGASDTEPDEIATRKQEPTTKPRPWGNSLWEDEK